MNESDFDKKCPSEVRVSINELIKVDDKDRPSLDEFMKGVDWILENLDILDQDSQGSQRYVTILNNNGYSPVSDFGFPRSMILKNSTGNVFQVIQLPNSFARLRPKRDLKMANNIITLDKLVRIWGLYGTTKHVARKEETIFQLFGIEEAFHAICQNAGLGYIFATYKDPQITFSQPKSQTEEDYSPVEFIALIAQYLYLTETHSEETEAIYNILRRIRDVTDLITKYPYPNYIESSIAKAIREIEKRFPNNDFFQREELKKITECDVK